MESQLHSQSPVTLGPSDRLQLMSPSWNHERHKYFKENNIKKGMVDKKGPFIVFYIEREWADVGLREIVVVYLSCGLMASQPTGVSSSIPLNALAWTCYWTNTKLGNVILAILFYKKHDMLSYDRFQRRFNFVCQRWHVGPDCKYVQ